MDDAEIARLRADRDELVAELGWFVERLRPRYAERFGTSFSVPFEDDHYESAVAVLARCGGATPAAIAAAVAAERDRCRKAVQALLDDEDFCGSDTDALRAAISAITREEA